MNYSRGVASNTTADPPIENTSLMFALPGTTSLQGVYSQGTDGSRVSYTALRGTPANLLASGIAHSF